MTVRQVAEHLDVDERRVYRMTEEVIGWRSRWATIGGLVRRTSMLAASNSRGRGGSSAAPPGRQRSKAKPK